MYVEYDTTATISGDFNVPTTTIKEIACDLSRDVYGTLIRKEQRNTTLYTYT